MHSLLTAVEREHGDTRALLERHGLSRATWQEAVRQVFEQLESERQEEAEGLGEEG